MYRAAKCSESVVPLIRSKESRSSRVEQVTANCIEVGYDTIVHDSVTPTGKWMIVDWSDCRSCSSSNVEQTG